MILIIPLHSFIVEDDQLNLITARFPPDAELLARKAIEKVA